jgi:hypothetical protein
MAEEPEWTVMFYFAGDNALSPLIVSQIKAVKDAGFQEHTNVLVHFDSNAKGAPTRLYEVNRKRKRDPKLEKTMIGDGNDPYVRNLLEDNLNPGDPDEVNPAAGPASAAISNALQRPDTINAKDALTNFVGFCRENYRAKHYLLFIIGHGLIVGNDNFLPDDAPVSAITLLELDTILRDFSRQVRDDGGAFEMLAMHSCSMSAIEVAYQLKGVANYMMSSEGTSYVGAWPYRQLLKKIFNTVQAEKPEARESGSYVPTLMSKLYYLTLYNGSDFMLSGYSLDLALCNIAEESFAGLKEPFQNLVAKLRQALSDVRGKELIQLAHLESQSYWQEDYTDLYDFCECLRRRCNEEDALQKAIKGACDGLIGKNGDKSNPFSALVVHSENFGSKYQYSHGLSIYFPWCEPTDDKPSQVICTTLQNGAQQAPQYDEQEEEESNSILRRYKQYAFTNDFEESSWFSFLKDYFDKTQRDSRIEEDGGGSGFIVSNFVPTVFDPLGALGPGGAKETGSFTKETGGYGTDCACPSIKNYPTVKVKIKGKEKKVRAASISEGLTDAFK